MVAGGCAYTVETELQPSRRTMQVSRKVPEVHLPIDESKVSCFQGKIEEEATTEGRICC